MIEDTSLCRSSQTCSREPAAFWHEQPPPPEVVLSVQRYGLRDWTGANTSIVRESLRAFGRTDSQIDAMTWDDVRAAFAAARIYQSQPAVDPNGRVIYLSVETASSTIVPVCLPATGQAEPVANGQEPAAAEGMYSVTAIAERFGIDEARLRKRLERWRRKHADGWLEVDDRSARAPKVLYRLDVVLPIIRELQSQAEARP